MDPEDQKFEKAQLKDSFQTTISMLKYVAKVDWRLLTITIISTAIPAIIPFVNLYVNKLIIDQVITSLTSPTLNLAPFYPLFAIRIISYFVQDTSFRIQSFVERLLWTKVPIRLYDDLFKKVASLDAYYFEDPEFKNLLERARQNYAFRPQNLVSQALYAFQSLVTMSIAFVALVQLNWFFTILITLVAVPEFIVQTQYSKVAWGIFGTRSSFRRKFQYLTSHFESYRKIKEIKLYQLAEKFLKEINNLQQQFYKDNKQLATKALKNDTIFNVFSTLVFLGIEIYVVIEVLMRRLSVGDVSFYTGVVSNFQNAVGGLFRNLNGVWEHSLYVKDIFAVLALEPKIITLPNAKILKLTSPPLIEFKDVSFTYLGAKKQILKSFNLTISPGEKIAFVGENGAGKSTIIKLLARFYDVDSGEILINGTNLKNINLDSWYDYMGVLFQDFNQYEDTVKSNIHFGNIKLEPSPKNLETAAKLAGAGKMINELPGNYEQMLGKTFDKGMELSGGQWQKIALSRAFFRNAKVLILDEPTASIDAKAEAQIFDQVEQISKEKTVILISHRFSTVRNADKIFVVDKGEITESGTHEQLIKLGKTYAKLFKLQAKGYR